MPVETIGSAPSHSPEDTENPGGIGTLNEMMDSPAETRDNRHPSPTGHALERTAQFLQERADRLQNRAVNKAHEEALNEYQSRDREGYADHMQALSSAANPNDEQREYATNRLVDERDAAHTEALKEYRERDRDDYIDHLAQLADNDNTNEASREFGQKELNREDRIESRRETREKAGRALRRFGRSALDRLMNAGLITAGMGILAAEATAGGVRSLREAHATRKSNAEASKAARKASAEAERERKRTEANAERQNRATAAAERRNKRRTSWAANRRRLGRFGRRTRAAGRAAKEAWKSFEDQI